MDHLQVLISACLGTGIKPEPVTFRPGCVNFNKYTNITDLFIYCIFVIIIVTHMTGGG